MQFNELKLNLCERKQATSGSGCSGLTIRKPRRASVVPYAHTHHLPCAYPPVGLSRTYRALIGSHQRS
ncbi:hypothetical protein M0802_009171 [Mischocyttarus mexicanus]|nr:hypothetical protein M0802_009171 [Mischocyttarus mexicanus]